MNDSKYNRGMMQGDTVTKATIAVLVVALIIAVWGWFAAAGEAGGESFEAALAVCEEPTTREEVEECFTVLEDFSETLQQYAEDLQDVELEEEPAPEATTDTGEAATTE